jgi:hypothetical protein
MAGVLRVIWGNGEAEYFCAAYWTKPMRDLADGQRDW